MTAKKRILCLVGCWWLAGCGAASGPASPTPVATKTASTGAASVALEPANDIKLSALLGQGRAELAAKAAGLEEKIQTQDQLRLQGRLAFDLLPDTRVPLAPPIWREAKYSKSRELSVPPYLQEDAKDTALALHLARHGDVDAALRLAEPGAEGELRKFQLDRNYPLEWTRLVGLMLHQAQFTLATGNIEGARELLAMHQQLRALLPEAAQRSALGRSLLPCGLGTLEKAAKKWRQAGQAALAQPVEALLAEVGVAPTWQWTLPKERAELSKHLGLDGDGPGVPAAAPLRAFDLLALPAPHAHAEACWTFFGADRQVREVLLAYRATQTDYHYVHQWLPGAEALPKAQPAVAASLSLGNPYSGGLIRIQFGVAPATELPRDFGVVHLDRGFESNRRGVAWKQHGDRIAVKDAKALSKWLAPAPAASVAVALEREPETDLVKRFQWTLAGDVNHSLVRLAQPLWRKHGLAQIETTAGIVLQWNDGVTRCLLRLPQDQGESPSLEVNDCSGKDLTQRVAAALARDRADRQVRWTQQQPLQRLPRTLETLTLGMKRADVDRLLPGGVSAVRREVPRGLMATYPSQPQGPGDAVVRTLIARFNDTGDLTELRVRYADHPSNKAGSLRKRLDALQSAHGTGKSAELATVSAQGAKSRKGSIGKSHSWQDDATKLSGTLDAGSLEVILRDCPAPFPEGEPLPPLTFLPRGPEGLALGDTKESLMAQGARPHEGAWLLTPKAKSPFDMILVWCENDQAQRIVGRWRIDAGKDRGKVLATTWGREISFVGWPWHQEAVGPAPTSWTTHDDVTTYRLFWQDDNLGAHLLSEWSSRK